VRVQLNSIIIVMHTLNAAGASCYTLDGAVQAWSRGVACAARHLGKTARGAGPFLKWQTLVIATMTTDVVNTLSLMIGAPDPTLVLHPVVIASHGTIFARASAEHAALPMELVIGTFSQMSPSVLPVVVQGLRWIFGRTRDPRAWEATTLRRAGSAVPQITTATGFQGAEEYAFVDEFFSDAGGEKHEKSAERISDLGNEIQKALRTSYLLESICVCLVLLTIHVDKGQHVCADSPDTDGTIGLRVRHATLIIGPPGYPRAIAVRKAWLFTPPTNALNYAKCAAFEPGTLEMCGRLAGETVPGDPSLLRLVSITRQDRARAVFEMKYRDTRMAKVDAYLAFTACADALGRSIYALIPGAAVTRMWNDIGGVGSAARYAELFVRSFIEAQETVQPSAAYSGIKALATGAIAAVDANGGAAYALSITNRPDIDRIVAHLHALHGAWCTAEDCEVAAMCDAEREADSAFFKQPMTNGAFGNPIHLEKLRLAGRISINAMEVPRASVSPSRVCVALS
jgi:hypothetical protein